MDVRVAERIMLGSIFMRSASSIVSRRPSSYARPKVSDIGIYNTLAVSQRNCMSSSGKMGAMSTRSAASAVSLHPPSYGQALHRCLQNLTYLTPGCATQWLSCVELHAAEWESGHSVHALSLSGTRGRPPSWVAFGHGVHKRSGS